MMICMVCLEYKNEYTKRWLFLEKIKAEYHYVELETIVYNMPIRFVAIKHDLRKNEHKLQFVNTKAKKYLPLNHMNIKEILEKIRIYSTNRVRYKENLFEEIMDMFKKQKNHLENAEKEGQNNKLNQSQYQKQLKQIMNNK